jgi:plastocyanin
MMKKFCLFCAALCLFTAVATACGGSDTTTEERETGTATMTGSPTTTAQATGTTEATEATEAPAPAGAATITIADMRFGDPVTVPPGAQITIKNDDSAEHSVTSQTAGQFDVHVDGNQQGTLTAPTEPGEYAFYCIYHPSMTGTLTVK